MEIQDKVVAHIITQSRYVTNPRKLLKNMINLQFSNYIDNMKLYTFIYI